MAGAQLFDIVVGATDRDFAGVVEAVAEGGVAAADAFDFNVDQVFAEDRDDALQRADPAEAFGRLGGRAPTHRLGPREGADDGGDGFGQNLRRRAAGLVDRGEPDAVAVFELVLCQAGLAEEAFKRLRGGAGAGAFEFLADGGGFQREVARDQGEAAGGDEAVDVFGLQASLCQFFGEEAGEVFRCLELHPGRDFFAAEFEEEVAHSDTIF